MISNEQLEQLSHTESYVQPLETIHSMAHELLQLRSDAGAFKNALTLLDRWYQWFEGNEHSINETIDSETFDFLTMYHDEYRIPY